MKPPKTARSNLDAVLEAEYREMLEYIDQVREEQIRQLDEMNKPPLPETIWPRE